MKVDVEEIQFLSDSEINDSSFFELVYYLEVLNDLERIYKSNVLDSSKNTRFEFLDEGAFGNEK